MTASTASRIGGHACTFLTGEHHLGTVVSVFGSGLNILFDQTNPPTLLSIQSGTVPLHPWAIEIGGRLDIEGGSQVETNPLSIRIRRQMAILWEGSVVVPLRLEPWTDEQLRHATYQCRELLLHGPDFGIDDLPMPLGHMLRRSFLSTLGDMDMQSLLKAIGSGPGSTPIADDIALGRLAALWAGSQQVPAAAAELHKFRFLCRSGTIRERTTLPSSQMLSAAAEGAFPEPILALISELGKPTGSVIDQAEKVAGLGATSGYGMIMGLLSGLSSLPKL